MIVLVTVMLAAASLDNVIADEEGWKPVIEDELIAIDYDNSKFELRTEIENVKQFQLLFTEYGDAIDGEDNLLMGWEYLYQTDAPNPVWSVPGCDDPRPGGPIDESIMGSEQIWTIWRTADNKMNVLCNGHHVLKDFVPTNDDDEVTGCARLEGYHEPEKMDWRLDWNTKVTAMSVSANGADDPFADVKGYRIVEDEKDEDEHDAWTSGVSEPPLNSWILLSTFSAFIPLWRF